MEVLTVPTRDPNHEGIDIRVVRARLGLSQQQLAARIGVSSRQISLYENGKSHPSKRTMDAVRKLLLAIVGEQE